MANPPEICYGHTQSYYLSDNFWVLAPSTYGFDVMPFKPLSENGDLFLYYFLCASKLRDFDFRPLWFVVGSTYN